MLKYKKCPNLGRIRYVFVKRIIIILCIQGAAERELPERDGQQVQLPLLRLLPRLQEAEGPVLQSGRFCRILVIKDKLIS